MTSSAFRDSMNSLGWSRRDPDVPANTSSSTPILSKLSSLNPFGRNGYVQLPTHEAPGAPLPAPSRREEEEGWFACKSALCMARCSFHAYPQKILNKAPTKIRCTSATDTDRADSIVSRWDRLLIFGGCNLAALACFVICFALFPVLSLKPRKFAIL